MSARFLRYWRAVEAFDRKMGRAPNLHDGSFEEHAIVGPGYRKGNSTQAHNVKPSSAPPNHQPHRIGACKGRCKQATLTCAGQAAFAGSPSGATRSCASEGRPFWPFNGILISRLIGTPVRLDEGKPQSIYGRVALVPTRTRSGIAAFPKDVH